MKKGKWLLLILLVLVTGACPQGSYDSGPTTGTLQITISGLPAGTNASVTVTYTNGTTLTMASDQSLTVTPGIYSVSAQNVTGGGSTYAPTVSGSPATVVAGTNSRVTVSYVQQQKSLQISVSAASLGFGAVAAGQTASQDLTISNAASSSLTLNVDVSVTGLGFSITSGGGSFSLLPGGSRTVTVQYAPPSNLSYAGTVSITHDATDPMSPISVPLSGSGFLSTPQNVAATQGAYRDRIRITWSKVEGATSYSVWRSVAPGAPRTYVGSALAPDLYLDDQTAGPASWYYYYVYAMANNASSSISSSAGGFFPYFCALTASQPAPNGVGFAAYYLGDGGGKPHLDTVNPGPPHWVFDGINQGLGFTFSGRKSVSFHVLGNAVGGASYCYVTIYVNNSSSQNQDIFVGSTWNTITIPASQFGTGANSVSIILTQNPNSGTTTWLWMDLVTLGDY